MSNRKELFRFLVTGLTAVGTDLLFYSLLQNWIDIPAAKAIGFISGSFVAFIVNKLWTFENDSATGKAAVQFAVLYSLTFCANVFVNSFVLTFIYEDINFAFLAATGTSTVLNYLGMKFWVFAPSRQSP